LIREKLRVLPRDAPRYHERQAAHLRALADRATRKGKQRLLEQAVEHERAAAGEEIVSDAE
jgi:hypothetical protein